MTFSVRSSVNGEKTELLDRLEKLGEVEYWPHTRTMTRDELAEALKDTDILVSHWGTPQVDAELLEKAPKLKLLAHAAGTVAHIASEAFYEKGIPVLSANPIMAKYVAEGALCYLLAGLRLLPQHDVLARENQWVRLAGEQKNLFGAKIGFVGCGAAAREFLDLLRPFGCDSQTGLQLYCTSFDPKVLPLCIRKYISTAVYR